MTTNADVARLTSDMPKNINDLKVKPKTESCEFSEHHPNGQFVAVEQIDVEGNRGRRFSLLRNTCRACGERWFTRINEK